MRSPRRPVAKLSPPVQPRVLSRPRLFARIDAGLDAGCFWIPGPAGAGKTALVASYLKVRQQKCVWYRLDEGDADIATFFHYLALGIDGASLRRKPALRDLTPDHRQGVTTFTRRFFERLGERFGAPVVLVFDNYQDVGHDSLLHELVPLGIGALPRHVSTILISRDGPPASFAALEVARTLTALSPDELILTRQEEAALVSLAYPRVGRARTLVLRERVAVAQGWAAGAVLQMEYGGGEGRPTPDGASQSPPALFSYLSKEVVGRLPDSLRAFLLSVCVLREMTVAIAEAISHSPDAKQHLERLHRTRNFTERIDRDETWYRFHPLFRATLLELAACTHSGANLQALRRRGAELFFERRLAGEGMHLLFDAGAWHEAADQICAIAPELMAQGRVDTLVAWIAQIPPDVRDPRPWLTYWLGAARMPADLALAVELFKTAFHGFRTASDQVGAIASWSGAAASMTIAMGDLSELDAWLDLCPFRVPDDLPSLPPPLALQSAAAMAQCLVWRRPGDPLTEQWMAFLKRLWEQLGRPQPTPAPFLVTYQLWKGRLDEAKAISDASGPRTPDAGDPAATCMACYTESVLAWFEGDAPRCVAAVSRGLETSHREGTHNWDHQIRSQAVYNALFQGDIDEAVQCLELVRPPTLTPSATGQHYRFLLSWCHLQRDDFARSWECQNPSNCVAAVVAGPVPEAVGLIVSTHAARELGRRDDAARGHERLAALAESIDSDLFRFGAGFLGAALAMDDGHLEKTVSLLTSALALGRRRGFMGYIGWHARTVANLCAVALRAGVETDYVVRLLRTRWLPLPGGGDVPDAWPWPIKIRTLGGFSIEVDGEILSWRRRLPRRQMDVLKLLIAAGTRGVPQQVVMDTLWPESDGDVAKETLDKTLQRLRRLLRYPGVMPSVAGVLRLNPDLCWVDAVTFEHLAERAQQRADDRTSAPARERALALYQGPFLPGDEIEPRLLATRSRLASTFRRLSAR